MIIVLEDALRADYLSAHGYERETSPNRTALMRDRGIQFDWAVSQATKTRPSVPALMTSLYPTATGRAGRFLPAVIPFVNTRVYRFRDDPTERSALLPATRPVLALLAQDLFSQLQEANMITQRRLTAGENVDLQFDPDTVIRSQHPVVGNCRHVAADNGPPFGRHLLTSFRRRA